jgi:hypothetical protein
MGFGGMESMRKGTFLILHLYRNCTQLNLQGIVDVLSKVSDASLEHHIAWTLNDGTHLIERGQS